ncbi:DUF1287 domain-containing protein [Microseira sp. BLCC-F43]|jgi:uncharacterized protein YijF (DUF1287 family)|uniref:DUF1287 domain-containing protein n=1 Tax=Microseira sp. BLCC-F43 TaxID=3153602 RepID=UPI0035B901D6
MELKIHRFTPVIFIITFLCAACQNPAAYQLTSPSTPTPATSSNSTKVLVSSPTIRRVIDNAIAQTKITRDYDPSYVRIPFPGGDVPMTTGVCTHVVIRAFRQVDIDLQKTVNEDMRKNFAAYPKNWGLKAPDPNIDHRRVPNLMTYFKRQGKALPISRNSSNYQPGDIVTWDLGGGQQHIGIVSDIRSPSGRLTIVHNIGAGTQVEDILFNWPIIGHYRYF